MHAETQENILRTRYKVCIRAPASLLEGEMKIFRIGKGDYEIDGHRVLMSWGNRRKANGQTGREIFVSPVAEDGTQECCTILGPIFTMLSVVCC
eukprot:3490087-Amphidinium_carterae.1